MVQSSIVMETETGTQVSVCV